MPAETMMQASRSAVEPLAQAFSTLMIGILPTPIGVQDHLAADRLLPGDEPGRAVADVGGLEIGAARARRPRRAARTASRAELLQALVGVLREAGHADTGDDRIQAHAEAPSR